MNWQDFNSPRRLYVTVSLQRLDRQVSGPITRAHFAPKAVKLLKAVPGHSRVLTGVGSRQAELADFLQQLEKPGHHPLLGGSARESWASDAKGPSLVTIEILQKSHSAHVGSETQKSSFINTSYRIWPKKNHEAMLPIETQGKGRTMAFSNKVNTQEEKPQSPSVQSHEDLWKGIFIRDGNVSPRRRPKVVSQYPELDIFEKQGLEGRKIQPQKKQLLQATLPIYRLEGRHEEEILMLKQETMNKRVKEKDTWLQFLPDKPFLGQKQRQMGSLDLGEMSLLDKRKTQALELSAKDHHLKSGSRAHTGNLHPFDHVDNNEATSKQSKQEKRMLRMECDPVTLANREQFPCKTCSEFPSDLRKLNFPIGRSNY